MPKKLAAIVANKIPGILVALCLLRALPAHAAVSDVMCPTMLLTKVAVQATISTRDVTRSDGSVIHVAQKPLLTFYDFTNADVTLTEGQIVLDVGLTPSSSKRWVDFTAKNVGTTVAFIVGDKVVKTPKIMDPNTGSGLLVGPFPREEAQKLAESINHKCAPTIKR